MVFNIGLVLTLPISPHRPTTLGILYLEVLADLGLDDNDFQLSDYQILIMSTLSFLFLLNPVLFLKVWREVEISPFFSVYERICGCFIAFIAGLVLVVASAGTFVYIDSDEEINDWRFKERFHRVSFLFGPPLNLFFMYMALAFWRTRSKVCIVFLLKIVAVKVV